MTNQNNDNLNLCETTHDHKNNIKNVKNAIPNDNDVICLSDIFKVLSDMSRLKIVFALIHSELCVCGICEVVGMSQSAISHQLRVLRSSHMVKHRKEGKMVYYSIDDEHVSSMIEIALEHMKHTYTQDF